MRLPESANVLLLGSGGREHAFAWKIAQSKRLARLFIAPGNAGTALCGTNVDINPTNFGSVKQFVLSNNINMVVVGPEEPLVRGIYDFFREDSQISNIPVIGPSALGARLEGSKEFAKDFMTRHGIPTARYRSFTKKNVEEAYAFLETLQAPYVLKADGLAAGKGVVIAETMEEADAALRDMLLDDKFGHGKVVVEDWLEGPEFSFMCFVDRRRVYPMALVQDHKRAYDGDEGPNTGGMGAYSPLPFVTGEDERYALERIMQPVADAMCAEGCPFTGVLYGGLMKTRDGIKVIEFNARFGDPETEVVLPRLKSDIVEIFSAVADGWELEHPLEWHDFSTVGVVLASKGYPGSYAKGAVIEGLDEVDGAVYHMGTASKEGRIVTAGGRVAIVVCAAPTLGEALEKCNREVGKVRCDNLFHRTDIGRKAIK